MFSPSILVCVLLVSLSQALGQDQQQQQQFIDQAAFGAAGENFAPTLEELFRARRQATPEQTGSSANVFKFFSELGPQVEKAQNSAKSFTTLFSSPQGTTPDQQQGSNPLSNAASALQATQLMSSLTDMLRSSQDTGNKLATSAQTNLQQAQQSTAQAAQQAQGGIQSALTEIGQGLQKIASNNPNLLPDVKNLYQSVSTKLSSASSSVSQAVPGSNAQQAQQQISEALSKPIQV